MKNAAAPVLFSFLMLMPLQCSFGQNDVAGDWARSFVHEDQMDRGAGPEPGNFLGLPLNEAGLLKAETWTASLESSPEHQCTPHPAVYAMWGPGTLTIGKEYDRLTRQLI